MKRVLLVAPDALAEKAVRDALGDEYRQDLCRTWAEVFGEHSRKRYEFIFADLTALVDLAGGPSKASDKEWHKQIRASFTSARIVVLAAAEKIREAVQFVKAGASDYLTTPINPAEIKLVIENILKDLRLKSELHYLRDQFWRPESVDLIRTTSPLMRQVYERIRSVAPTKTTVLLTGETGTGKGMIARLIHGHSQRKEQQFISVHCGAIPENLVESELFGHERGAFTGAVKRRLGKFEIAQGGTLFLDEIGTITPSVQIKLLQVLQDHLFQRVGGEADIESDARIIAATNVDLKALADKGMFRSDLFYRFSVFPIQVPPLRERLEDMPFLVETVLKRLNQYSSKNVNGIHPDALAALCQYSWPGNIRELENLIERAYILETTDMLMPDSFPSEILSGRRSDSIPLDTTLTLSNARNKAVNELEKKYLKEILARHKGRIDASAKAADISTRQLHKLLVKHGLRKEDFKTSSQSAE